MFLPSVVNGYIKFALAANGFTKETEKGKAELGESCQSVKNVSQVSFQRPSPLGFELKSSGRLLNELRSAAAMTIPKDILSRLNSDANDRIKGTIINYIVLIKQGKDYYSSNNDNESLNELSRAENKLFALVKKRGLGNKSPFGEDKSVSGSKELMEIKGLLQNTLPNDFFKLGDVFIRERIEPLLSKLESNNPLVKIIIRDSKEIIDNLRQSNHSNFMISSDPMANRIDDLTTIAKILDLVEGKLIESKIESPGDDKENRNKLADNDKPNPQSAEFRRDGNFGGSNNGSNNKITINIGDTINIKNIHNNNPSGVSPQPSKTSSTMRDSKLADAIKLDNALKETPVKIGEPDFADGVCHRNITSDDINCTEKSTTTEMPQERTVDSKLVEEAKVDIAMKNRDDNLVDVKSPSDMNVPRNKNGIVDTPAKKNWPPVSGNAPFIGSAGSAQGTYRYNAPRDGLSNNPAPLRKESAQPFADKNSNVDNDDSVDASVKKNWPPVSGSAPFIGSAGSAQGTYRYNAPRNGLSNNPTPLRKEGAQPFADKNSNVDNDDSVDASVKKNWPPVSGSAPFIGSAGSAQGTYRYNAPRNGLSNNPTPLRKEGAQPFADKNSNVDNDDSVDASVKSNWPPVPGSAPFIGSAGSAQGTYRNNGPRNGLSNSPASLRKEGAQPLADKTSNANNNDSVDASVKKTWPPVSGSAPFIGSAGSAQGTYRNNGPRNLFLNGAN
ncbi:hypothetical protein [Serratia marcescens]|uniref:hypothetical protein n=1 Tax=Serratia marcescens TaxID=615 RepID=UPI00148D55ED|nr:hypothetical protein [Serratia marcescens]QJU42312.1 hypothetical protein HMI62_24710 [Serratia marcescens]